MSTNRQRAIAVLNQTRHRLPPKTYAALVRKLARDHAEPRRRRAGEMLPSQLRNKINPADLARLIAHDEAPADLLERIARKLTGEEFTELRNLLGRTTDSRGIGLNGEMEAEDDDVDVDAAVRIINLCAGKLNSAEMAELEQLLGAATTMNRSSRDDDDDSAVTEDEPPPFSGRPRPGGGMDPIRNGASDSVIGRFPMVARLGVEPSTAMDARPEPARDQSPPDSASLRRAGARIARTGDPATSRKVLEDYIKGLPRDLQEACRAGYEAEMKNASGRGRLGGGKDDFAIDPEDTPPGRRNAMDSRHYADSLHTRFPDLARIKVV